MGRIPLEVSPVDAARAGQEILERFRTLFEGTLQWNAAGPDRFRAYMEACLDTLVRHIEVTDSRLPPTACTYELRARRGELVDDPDPRLHNVARSLRDQWDDWYPVSEVDRTPEARRLRHRFYVHVLEVVDHFNDGGVSLLAGTDPGRGHHRPGECPACRLPGNDPGRHRRRPMPRPPGAGSAPGECGRASGAVLKRFRAERGRSQPRASARHAALI